MNAQKHPTIYAALAAAQMDMGPALKQAVNPAFKSRYADLANVADACLPALNKHGIAVIQPFSEADGQRYIKTVFLHESGERLETMVPLIMGKNDMQGLGSAMTYARRYGLMSMAGIAPEDDDGNAAAASLPKGPINAAQTKDLGDLIRATNTDPAKFSAVFKVESPSQIQVADFDRARGMLMAKQKKMQEEEARAKAEFDAQQTAAE